MALTQCPVCDRVYPAHRARCPQCGTENTAAAAPDGKPGAPGRKASLIAGLVLVAGLAAVFVFQRATLESGPDPAVEALHSPEEALQYCRNAVDSLLPAGDYEIVSPFEVDYLGGGEYEVAATLDVQVGGRGSQRAVLCEFQFTQAGGWTAEQILLEEG